jgi:hypothetical protein
MKASELRIGNWVQHTEIWSYRNGDAKCFNFPLLISDFYAEVECTIEIEKLQPIPLTEEWLLKFGFIKYGMSYADSIFVINLWSNGLFMPQYQYRHGKRNPIKYVHQLQNLYFALTSEELTIK